MKKIYTYSFRSAYDIRKYARKMNLTLTEFIEEAIKDYIKKIEKRSREGSK